jgi:hypothetical protein
MLSVGVADRVGMNTPWRARIGAGLTDCLMSTVQKVDKLRTYPSLGEAPMAIWSTRHRLGLAAAGSRRLRVSAC